MKLLIKLLPAVAAMMLSLTSCGDDPDSQWADYVPARLPADTCSYRNSTIWLRHHDSSLKILAIGNSFTINAATFIPGLVGSLNADSICVARLTRSGCSLDMHWASHVYGSPDYDLHYSDAGRWASADIRTIDGALQLFDWDIIVIQQASYWSGMYSTFQPYLDNLARLFRETNPGAKLAWHYTWAYTPTTQHSGFANYGYDSDKMFEAIMKAGDEASKAFDIRIPSALLIKRMREEFADVEDGFSEDGYHIADNLALYALSSLWYEVLVGPSTGISSIGLAQIPSGVDAEDMEKVGKIIRSLVQTGTLAVRHQ